MRLLAFIGFLAIAGGVAAAAYFFGGFYSVAGTAEDPAVVHWALVRVRTASIERHATDRPPANIDDPATVQEGARIYLAQGCATCHGGPGVAWVKFSEGLHPDPPDLKEVAGELSAAQIFWVVKNGINMTGMPSFAAAGVKDEDIWKIASFVKKLPNVSETDFKTWTAQQQAAPAAPPAAPAATSTAPSPPPPPAQDPAPAPAQEIKQ
jgi:mono/diheme cytochrome c family protein